MISSGDVPFIRRGNEQAKKDGAFLYHDVTSLGNLFSVLLVLF